MQSSFILFFVAQELLCALCFFALFPLESRFSSP